MGVPPSRGLLLLDKLLEVKEQLVGAKEQLLAGLLGDGGNCGCPCRDYFVAKCHVEYVEECHQAQPSSLSSLISGFKLLL